MKSARHLRVALIAPCCDGTDVGEAWSTFQWASRLARRHELTILTYHKRDRPSTASQLPGEEVVEWRDWPLVGRFERFNSGAKPGYIGFYLAARRWLRRARAAGRRFDLIHQVSPLALRYPSPGVGLDTPLIVGPVGGSLEAPEAFRAELGSSPWYMRMRGIDRLRFERDPWLRRTYREAAVVVAVAPYVKELLASVGARRFEYMSETGVVELAARTEPAVLEPGALRLLYVGRLVRTKGLRDLVRALAKLSDLPNVTLDVLGRGPDGAACEAEAKRLGVSERVRFHGQVPRARVDDFYRQASLFAFPSFCEPSGNVVFEALGYGLPVLTARRGGPGFVVDERCGVRVDVESPEQLAADLAEEIRSLARDPERLSRLRRGALERIAELALWDNKIERMCELYDEVAA